MTAYTALAAFYIKMAPRISSTSRQSAKRQTPRAISGTSEHSLLSVADEYPRPVAPVCAAVAVGGGE